MKYTTLLAAVFISILSVRPAFAMSCQAQMNEKTFAGQQVDVSDIKIDLENDMFIWIGLIGQKTMTVYLMRPATEAEKEQAYKEGERTPPSNTGIASRDVTLADLTAGSSLGEYNVKCSQ